MENIRLNPFVGPLIYVGLFVLGSVADDVRCSCRTRTGVVAASRAIGCAAVKLLAERLAARLVGERLTVGAKMIHLFVLPWLFPNKPVPTQPGLSF